jgi:hypothetical protein
MLHRQERAGEVGAEHRVPLLEGGQVERSGRPEPGVRHHHREPPEPGGRRTGRLDAGLVGDVAAHGVHLRVVTRQAPDLGGTLGEALHAAPGEQHRGAVGGERSGAAQSDTAAAAGDECDLTVEDPHRLSLLAPRWATTTPRPRARPPAPGCAG